MSLQTKTGNKRLFDRIKFHYYGKYGGPGYTAGKFTKKSEVIDWTVLPVDKLDRAFKVHDWYYTQGEFDLGDHILLSELAGLTPKQLGLRGYLAKQYFRLQDSLRHMAPTWTRNDDLRPGEGLYPKQPNEGIVSFKYSNPWAHETGGTPQYVYYSVSSSGSRTVGTSPPQGARVYDKGSLPSRYQPPANEQTRRGPEPQRRGGMSDPNRGALRSLAGVAVAAAYSGPMTRPMRVRANKDMKSICVDGSDYLGVVSVNTSTVVGSNLLNIDINPSMVPNTTIAYYANMYERWRPKNFQIRYVGQTASTQAGSIVMSFDPDPSDSPLSGIAAVKKATSSPFAQECGVWEKHIAAKFKYENGNELFTSAGDDERLYNAGTALITSLSSFSASMDIGNVFMDYEFEFYQPLAEPSINNTNVCYLEGGAYTTADSMATAVVQSGSNFIVTPGVNALTFPDAGSYIVAAAWVGNVANTGSYFITGSGTNYATTGTSTASAFEASTGTASFLSTLNTTAANVTVPLTAVGTWLVVGASLMRMYISKIDPNLFRKMRVLQPISLQTPNCGCTTACATKTCRSSCSNTLW